MNFSTATTGSTNAVVGTGAGELSTRYEELLRLREPYRQAWHELAEQFLPSKFRDNDSEDGTMSRRGLLNSRLVDSAGVLAMRTLAAGLQGGMTSPARPWFRLTMEDEHLANYRGVREYLDEVTKRMQAIFHRSNFYNAIHAQYADIGTFGTACMFELADMQRGFYFIPLHAGEFVIDTDYKGRVDTVFRKYFLSARQLVQEFGKSAVPGPVVQAADKGLVDRYRVIHAVYPKPHGSAGRAMAYSSVHYLDGGGGATVREKAKPILRSSGYVEFPAFAPRWDIAGTDVYGRSPAMDVLPDCKMLQQMAITTLKATHKAVDPPMSVDVTLQSTGLNMMAGGQNFVAAGPGQPPVAAVPLMQVRPDLQAAYLAMDNVKTQIRTGLYNDLFRMLYDSQRSQITATEIAAKEQEKLILIGPVLERLHAELFIPLIDRTFNLMARLDMLPQAPQELAGRDVQVEFVSLLAQAQKMVSTGALAQQLAFTMNVAQALPEALDSIDTDKIIDAHAEYVGVEVGVIRAQEERDALRAQRAQAQQQAQQQQAMQQLVTSGKDLSGMQVDKDGTNALEALLG